MNRLPLLLTCLVITACASTIPHVTPRAGSPSVAPRSAPPVATASVSASSALPSFPAAAPIPGRIAYNTDDHATWIMNADGSDAHRVSNPGANGNDFDPRWSPEGDAITFRSSRGVYGPDTYTTGTEGIWIIDLKSGKERQLFPPDDRTIGGLFAAPGPSGLVALSTVDEVDGRPREVITLVDRTGKRQKTFEVGGGSAECSLWSPDGSMIAFCSHPGGFFSSDGTFAVWVMNADGSNQRKLSDAPGSADPNVWAPDGQRLAYNSGIEGSRHVFVTDLDGREQRQLTNLPGTQVALGWLPDDRVIVAWSPSDSPHRRWLTMRDDGADIAEIAAFEEAGVTDLAWHQ